MSEASPVVSPVNMDPMDFIIHRSGRIQLVDVPHMPPGKCAICGGHGGSADRRKFIDFNIEVEYFGVIYFCEHCFAEAAIAIKFISPEIYEKILDLLEVFKGRNQELEAENVKLRSALHNLDFLGTSNIVDSTISKPIDSVLEKLESDSDSEITESDNSGPKKSKSGSSKQVDERRSENILVHDDSDAPDESDDLI